jgi:succinate dehydrogenase / fumarate reductase cytochrome b subunit
MNRLVRLFGTSLGRELIMAATGALLIVFVVIHMLGNMKVYQGPDALNSYAARLIGHPLLWVVRLGLLSVFGVHVYLAFWLARRNRVSRPLGYQRYTAQKGSVFTRHLMVSGLMILAFVVYHLLHFTLGVVDSGNVHLVDAHGRRDVYSMVVRSFGNPWISASYVVAMVLLGFHLIHGAKSLFQTVGINHESYNRLIAVACAVLVAIIVVGNCSIPILVLAGAIRPPGG